MKIGHGGAGVPLCHPRRLAEEVANHRPDQTGPDESRRRPLGLCHTYATYGGEYGESRERFADGPGNRPNTTFKEERFSYSGKYFTFNNVRLAPKSRQQPWPEIRVAAASPTNLSAIGRAGHAISSPPAPATARSWRTVKSYREAWKESGPSRARAGESLSACVYVADTEDRARRAARGNFMHACATSASGWLPPRQHRCARKLRNRAERGPEEYDDRLPGGLRERMIVGTPSG